ncbi:MAG: ABC transporter permease [Anaerolineales bacterium]|nr:MAG: ABC transporter permease [Anaerolineales bacterium]
MWRKPFETDRKSNNYKRVYTPLVGYLAIILFFLLWESVARAGIIRPLFISSPSRILQAASWLLQQGLLNDIWVSGTEFVSGMLTAILIGLPLGILIGWYPTLSAIFDPFIAGLYSTPRIALLPLLILWFGIGAASKIAVVFLGAVFPILVSTIAGIRAVDEDLLTCARAFGGTDRQIFSTLALPSSVPYILSGLRLGVGRGLVGVIVGEFIAARAGIGHMMNIAASTFQTDQVFVGIMILAGTGVLLNGLLIRLENRFDQWRTRRS